MRNPKSIHACCTVTLSVLAIASWPDAIQPNISPQESLVDNVLDAGFDYLLAPNVFELEDGIKIHPLQLGPSMAYLIESESGLVLVDAGVPELDKIILAYMKHIGRDDLKLIYITHAHLDHYGSAEALREATGAQITVQAADAGVMAAGETRLGTVRDWETVSDFALPTIEEWLAVLEPTPPDFVVEDGDRLDEFGIDAYVVHTPGHTPGSSVLMLDDRYAFVGRSGLQHRFAPCAEFLCLRLGSACRQPGTRAKPEPGTSLRRTRHGSDHRGRIPSI